MTGSPEVLFEFTRLGNVVRVTAVDSSTLQEVTIQGPAAAGEVVLRRTALAKLQYMNGKLTGQTGQRRPA